MHVLYQGILQKANPDYSELWGHSGQPQTTSSFASPELSGWQHMRSQI